MLLICLNFTFCLIHLILVFAILSHLIYLYFIQDIHIHNFVSKCYFLFYMNNLYCFIED